MKVLLLAAAAVSLAFGAEPVQLFNGKDLTGWRMVGLGRFVVEDGLLKTEGGMGLLYYTGQKFGNQTLRVVFKTAGEHANSGVYIRLPEMPPDPWYGVHEGYEVQIDAAGDEWHCTGALYSLSRATKRTQKPSGEWNTLEIQLDGQTTRVMLNGEQVNEFRGDQQVPERKMWFEPVRGPRPELGYIGLQNHDRNSTVYFKEVSVLNGTYVKPNPMAQGDRERMLSYFQSTRKQVLDAVAGLSQEQLTYKPGPERWSIAQIVEHLTLAEKNMFDYAIAGLTSNLAAPEAPLKDDELVSRMKDRSHKAQAPETFRPSGKWSPGSELNDEFRLRRDANSLWIRDTQDNLRGHYIKGPIAVLSVYQMLLLIPGHTERHLAQIAEVKASPGFPNK